MGKETEHKLRMDALERMRFVVRQGSPQFVGATTAMRVVRLIDAWAATPEIAAEAAKCPELEQGIVRLAQSPLYGSATIKSLATAVEFLGYEELRRAMLTLAITAWTPACPDSAAFDMLAFRRRAVTLAHMSEAVSRHLGLEHPTRFFLAGMFADIGYMFLAYHTPYSVRHIALTHRRTPGVTLEEAEYYSVGFTHAELSAVAAEEFGFENEVVQAIRHHTSPSEATEDSRLVADVVHVSSVALDSVGVLADLGLPPMVADPSSIARLACDLEGVNAQLVGVFDRADQVMGAIKSTIAA